MTPSTRPAPSTHKQGRPLSGDRRHNASAAYAALLAAGIVVRDQRATPQLHDALRISIGTPAQNARVLAALEKIEVTS